MNENEFVYETENFYITAKGTTFLSREDGGHIRIKMKDPVANRTELSPQQAIEYIRLSIVAGESLKRTMNQQGVKVVNINYQDMGNWAWKKDVVEPKIHMHIFGRCLEAKTQIFPEAVQLPALETGFYDDFESLTDEDISILRKEIETEFQKEKYKDENWVL
jgi:diadenosine tetraphosphate (Ap4A) HIT family hydrolase